MESYTDTIAAPATPMSVGAVGILRLSGSDSERIAGRIFKPSGGVPLEGLSARVMTRGVLRDGQGRVFDHCMACVMRAPHSYTGDTVVELYLHGSPALMSHALTLLYDSGARPALPGEFTRRAVMNGKLDLLQAEAVADLIESRTALEAGNAAAHLDGSVSRRVNQVWELLTGVIAHVAACVDYPEDDVPEITGARIRDGLQQASELLARLEGSYRRGLLLNDGALVVLAGCPNSGKSSLFNALLGYDRAIVTPVPGTTRDTIEAAVTLCGLRFRLADTAGIRDANDQIETEGIRRAMQMLDSAHLALVVLDGSRRLTDDDRRILDATSHMPRVVAVNKSDLDSHIGEFPGSISVSAVTGEGLDRLAAALSDALPALDDPRRQVDGEVLITNARHARSIGMARVAVDECRAAIESGVPEDAALTVLESALDILAELTGKRAGEAVLEQIFSRFCVGK